MYNMHIWDGHLSIHSDTFSVFLQDVISPSYSRLLDWPPSTVSHKGGLCGSHSLPVLAHWTSQRGSLKLNGTQNKDISVEAC